MRKTSNLNGMKYGRLTVLYDTEKINEKTGSKYCMCRCSCGRTIEVMKTSLKSGNTKSCGCLNKERLKKQKIHYKHGGTHTKLYNLWWKIKQRCYCEYDNSYKNYGGRGITMCDEWLNDYIAFKEWAIKNGYKEGLSIDRIDNDGNYEPSNCRWATKKEQANNRRTNIKLAYNNETHNLKEWAELLNINDGTLRSRYVKGYKIEDVLSKTYLNNKKQEIL